MAVSKSPGSTTPRRAPATSVPAKPCAAPPSSTPGAIPTSTSAATAIPAKAAIITLTVEHRAALAMPSVTLELAQRANALAREVSEQRTPQTPRPVPSTSASPPLSPMSNTRCRLPSCVRAAVSVPPPLYQRLAALTAADRLGKSDQGYRLAGR
jgi:hypothetical protein